LAFGVFLSVQSSLQSQQSNSHASGGQNITGDYNANLVGDNYTVSGNIFGNLIGSINQIGGNVFGSVEGSNNHIGGNVVITGSDIHHFSGNVFGDNNTVAGNVFGCLSGNNNTVAGNVFGGVYGHGNSVHGNILPLNNNPCPFPPPVPTPTPTMILTPTPTGNCADGIDNNGNELTDSADPACHTDCNNNNPNSYSRNLSEDNRCSLTPSPSTAPTITRVPTVTVTISPRPTCIPRPGCLDNVPKCVPPNPIGGYCPITPTVTASPTVTTVPGDTSFSLNLLLHGIGSGGDSANQKGGGNPHPVHQHRRVEVEVFSSTNTLVVTKIGAVDFNSSVGNFTGTIDMGTTLTSGDYTVKVKTDQFLRALVPGIQTITRGTVNSLPQATMINGDINGDNAINILDYNILIGCYSDFKAAVSCTSANKLLADLDDDGNVNQVDLNLFLRELTNRHGE